VGNGGLGTTVVSIAGLATADAMGEADLPQQIARTVKKTPYTTLMGLVYVSLIELVRTAQERRVTAITLA
jgi:hypothetical protein